MDPLVDALREHPQEPLDVRLSRLERELGKEAAERVADVVRRHLLARVQGEARVEHGVGHELLLPLLVGRELRASGVREDDLNAGPRSRAAQVGEQEVHDRLRHVRDHAQPPLEVTADRGVAHGLLGHVARLQEEPARRVRPVPHPLTADPRLNVLLRDGRHGLVRLQHGPHGLELPVEGVVDGQHLERHAELRADGLSPAPWHVRRVARRHVEGPHQRAAARVRLGLAPPTLDPTPHEQEREQTVSPARERDADRREPILLPVVADPERQRVEQLLGKGLARVAPSRAAPPRQKEA